MIPVKKQPPPANFVEKVEKPGNKLLAENPHPKKSELKPYWRRIERELYEAYNHICAYSCLRIERVTGGRTVEHFKPTSKCPEEAYSWDNYRLVCWRLNGRKGDHEDVLDPFTLPDGWFVIDFPSLLMYPGEHLTEKQALQVKNTIKRLKLNDEESITDRQDKLRKYVMYPLPFGYLEEIAPFIALELKRQGLADITHPMWAAYQRQKSRSEE